MGSCSLLARASGLVVAASLTALLGCNGGLPPATADTATAASTAASQPSSPSPPAPPAVITTTAAPLATLKTNSLGVARAAHTATLLPSGEVLVVGGVDASGKALDLVALVTATTVKQGPHLAHARFGHTATLLETGEVLIAGGETDAKTVLGSTEIYDPLAGSFAPGPNLGVARAGAVAVAFGPKGSQLVAIAGGNDGTKPLDAIEVYDVKARSVRTVGKLAEAFTGAQGALLEDGTILLAGGASANAPANAERIDPNASTITVVPGVVNRAAVCFAATSREVTVLGGQTLSALERSGESYGVATRAFAQSGALAGARRNGTATAFESAQGVTLVVIGGVGQQVLGSIEILRGPTLAQASVAASATLRTARFGHTATALANGHVLVIGGLDANGLPLDSTEDVDPNGAPYAATPSNPAIGSGTTGTGGSGTGSTGTGSSGTGSTGTGSTGTGTGSTGTGSTGTGSNGSGSNGSGSSGSGSSFWSVLGGAALGALGQTIGQGGLNNGVGGFVGSFLGNLAGNLIGGLLGGSGGSGSGSIGSGIGSVIGGVLSGLFGGSTP